MSRSCRKFLPEVREWSGSPSGGPGVVGRPSQKSGSGREALLEVWELLRAPPGGPEVAGRPS